MDWRALPVRLAATLAMGLGPNSRVRTAQAGARHSIDTLLLAGIFDQLAFLSWTKTRDARTESNRPTSILRALSGPEAEEEKSMTFRTGEEFEAARAAIIQGRGGY